MSLILRVLALLLLSSILVCAQSTGRDSTSGSVSEQSLAIYETAVEVAGQLHDPKLLGKSYYNLAAKYLELNKIDKAIDAYERSGQCFKEAGLLRDLIYIYGDLGALFFNQENFHKAREYSEASIHTADSIKNSNIAPGAWPDDFGRARALHTLAEIDLREGNHVDAIDKLQSSLKLYEQLNDGGSKYDVSVAGVYAALGKVYPETGDYSRGLFYLNKALEIAKTQSDGDLTANLRNSIGYLYMEQEDYAQAKENFDRSLKIYLADNNLVEAAKVFLNLGVIEQRQAHYDDALTQFNFGLNAAKTAQTTDAQLAANEGIGVVLTTKRNFAGALEAFTRSLAIAKETNNKTRQTELSWRSAQVYYEMRDYERSSEIAEQSVNLARSAHLPKLTYLSSTTLGQSYAAQNKIELAIETLRTAVEQVEAMRDGVAGQEQELQFFMENKVAPYTALVDLLLQKNRPVDALLYAERAKGRVLLDILSGGKADLSKVLTPTEKDETQRLNRNISEINERIKKQEAIDSSSLNSLYTQLDTARLNYQSYQDGLYSAHPELGTRRGRTATLNDADIKGLTQVNDRAYLEYVVGRESIFLFVLSKDKSGGPDLKVYPIAMKPEELAQRVNQFHQRLGDRHQDFLNLGRELYALLIEPAAQQISGIETICIVPDGFLWNLPFQALVYKGDRYLIEDHPLYYAPSLGVLREMTKGTAFKEKSEPSLIAFGNPVIGRDAQRNEELCPLPEAEAEVNSVAKTFPPLRNKAFVGREASEKTFKALAPAYATIHLATHGVLDNRQPLYSHLLLTKTDGDPENDGLLEAREIMNMKLQADLAVLSACETANGRLSPGEGVMGTSWAFFVAGVHSMLVSQWKVNSASTSQLMTNFYQALESKQNQSPTKARSLQAATLRLMKDDRYRHPFYWAGFVLVGSNN